MYLCSEREDIPDIIAAGRLMHAGDVNSISAESVTALGYARDHPSKYSRYVDRSWQIAVRYVDRNLPTADGKCHL